MKEAGSRIIIDKLLRESGWVLPGDNGNVNVEPELTNKKGEADYVLMDSKGFPLDSKLPSSDYKRFLKIPKNFLEIIKEMSLTFKWISMIF